MSNRIDTKIILGSERNKTSVDVDSYVNISLSNKHKELDEFDRNVVLNLQELFDEERQKSNIFRINANLDLIFDNIYSGTTNIAGNNYSPFTNYLYYVNSQNSFGTQNWSGYPQYQEFDFIRTDNDVQGYTTSNTPNPPHVNFVIKSSSTYNWMIYASYPYENDESKILQYYRNNSNSNTWISGDGIPFYIVNPYSPEGLSLISFVCPVRHNLAVGEFVELNITGWNGYNGRKVFQVASLGNEGYNSELFVFNIFNEGFTGGSFSNSSEGTFKRIIDINNSAETKSIYYVRKHKILTNIEDLVLTKAAFDNVGFSQKRQFEFSSLTPNNESRITTKEGNQSYLISFLKDIDISDLRDNLNRPLTELFITIVNRGYFGWMNRPIFSNIGVREGYDFNLTGSLTPYWSLNNFGVNLSNIQTDSYVRNQGSTPFTFYYNKFLKTGDTLNGSFCEFNRFEQRERVISEIYHKLWYNPFLFNITKFPTINPNGYYYKPHYSIKIRDYSNYLEEAEVDEVDNVPFYSFYSRYYSKLIWRDIYTYGFIDEQNNGTDFPFVNGAHYPSRKIIFKLLSDGFTSENINTISQPITDDCE